MCIRDRLQADAAAVDGRAAAVVAEAGDRLVVIELAGGAEEPDATPESLRRATALVVAALPP